MRCEADEALPSPVSRLAGGAALWHRNRMFDLDDADLDLILEHTGPVWDELRGQRLFITGGTGFFGRWLLASLAAANARRDAQVRVVALTRRTEAFRQAAPALAAAPWLELWPGDVRSFAFPPGHFSHVVHAATDTSTAAAARPAELIATIVDGTRQVLAFAAQAGAAKLLLTSSGAIYGPQPAGLTHLPESYGGAPDPVDPRSAYGQAKRLAEQLCALPHPATPGLETKIARCFAFVGPHLPLDGHFAIGNFIRDALERHVIAVNGDGTPVRSYLYAADLTVWLWTILTRGLPGLPYNVGSDAGVTIAELARTVARTVAPTKPVRITHDAREDGFRSVYVPDIGRARDSLGLEVWTDLPTAIARTAAWHRQPETIP